MELATLVLYWRSYDFVHPVGVLPELALGPEVDSAVLAV
jgi:hypothetical protein